MKWFLTLLFSFALLPLSAYAADSYLCADDDNNGVVDILKTAGTADRDCDGQTADSGTGGGDCDDTDWRIFKGQYTTSGCSAGQWRQCDPAGSAAYCRYSSTASQTCALGGVELCTAATLCERGTCYYIDAGTGDNANTGTYASPFADFAPVSKGGAHEAGADTAIYLKGTVNLTAVQTRTADDGNGCDRIVFQSNHDGTSANSPNLIRRYPGSTAVVAPGTTSTHCAIAFYMENNYWDISDLNYTGGYGPPVSIDGNYNRIYANYIHDVQGSHNGNLAGVRINSDSLSGTTQSHNYIHHNIINQIYDPVLTAQSGANSDRENVSAIAIFAAQDNKVEYNRVGMSHTPDTAPYEQQMGYPLKEKHSMYYSSVSSISTFNYNIIYNAEFHCIGINMPKMQIKGNLGFKCAGIQLVDFGGCPSNTPNPDACWLVDGVDIENNTFANANDTFNNGRGHCLTAATNILPYANPTHTFTFKNNVCVDTTAAYSANGKDMNTLFPQGDATLLTAVETYLSSTLNCYYNSTVGMTLTNGFRAVTTDLGLTGWQGVPYLFDTDGYSENVALDANKAVTSPHCLGRGWEASWPSAASSSSSSSSSSQAGLAEAFGATNTRKNRFK